MTYQVLIDQQPVVFGRAEGGPLAFDWVMTMGVSPYIQSWELPKSFVLDLLSKGPGREVTLHLGDVEISRVVLLGDYPSGNPQTLRLLMADVRWYWLYRWLVRDFNLRRRVGDQRLVGSTLLQNQVAVDSVKYAAFSINADDAWTYDAENQNVLTEAALSGYTGYTGPAIAYRVDASPTLDNGGLVVEETSIDDPMPAGLARALSALPGRSLYVDLDGLVHVCDATPGAERAMIDAFPPSAVNKGDLHFVNWSGRRPARYRVLFDPELEVRIDKVSPPSTGQWGSDGPFMENVLPVPDKSLAIPEINGRKARTVGQGTWITFPEAYAAWGAPPDGPPASTPLSDDVVRAFYLGPWLRALYVMRGLPQADPIWSRRIDAVVKNFRQTFRVNVDFWSRVRSAQTLMASIWDIDTGTRASSPVFCDHARRESYRSLMAGKLQLGENATSWNAVYSLCERAPADVALLDPEQGILKFVWQDDVSGQTLQTAPSGLDATVGDTNGVPSIAATGASQRSLAWPYCRLVADANFNASTILSLVPGAPNDRRRLFEVVVEMADVLSAMNATGLDVSNVAGQAPDQELRVRAGLTTARGQWSDDGQQQSLTMATFGVTGAQVVAPDDSSPPPSVSQMTPINLESELKPVAKAVAACDVFTKLDHYEGTVAPPFDATIRPIGSAQIVTHRFERNRISTIVACSAPKTMPSPFAFLEASARKILLRQPSSPSGS